MITAIAVTVDIVARRGAAGMSERPAQRVQQRCLFVDRTMTNQAMVATYAKVLVGNFCKQPEEGTIRIVNINEMMKMVISLFSLI